ncbi:MULTISPECIES: hypothetical protein [Bacillus]|uniref:hypothetical protein n=1 Tax=Bacillus TaxID=1386 RepID=UPI00032ECDC2|nr:hypothetical protein ICS_02728 [Bacillus cereus BAG2O-3]EOQ11307.1 hypothetical protein KQ3_02162 [Bacillus cereus B5-2]EOQ30082.1 hypothetical protein KQ1_02825 [Bacillus cereus BAG3O-1]PEW24455.1 hypothetical protein CN431_30565 [Bacillus cereus]PFW81977.1 hypothetical protein COL27_18385 [Bacillus sp. AFS075960]RFB13125.1 hypothetical protein DZB88_14475 [Bacillus sp. OE]RFB43452.1 hypothetical protein DZB83_23090 [Bacillus sp. dmp10]
MNNATNFHRAFGVYGICIENNNILVIDKIKGPYRSRYDLPGGSLEDGEAGIYRQFHLCFASFCLLSVNT